MGKFSCQLFIKYKKHQWYVRCDCYSSVNSITGVPYTFNDCSYLNIHYFKSAKLDEEVIPSLKHVQIVNQENIYINTFDDLILFSNRFSNIRHLEITLPLIDNFHSCNWSFNQLITSLIVKLNTVLGYHHLQIVLDRAHQLYTLKFCSFGGLIMELFQ